MRSVVEDHDVFAKIGLRNIAGLLYFAGEVQQKSVHISLRWH